MLLKIVISLLVNKGLPFLISSDKETEDKIQLEIKKTEERVALEKKQALIDLEDQLKDSATSFLGKITNLNKEDIKI